jgi:hypothetical protein
MADDTLSDSSGNLSCDYEAANSSQHRLQNAEAELPEGAGGCKMVVGGTGVGRHTDLLLGGRGELKEVGGFGGAGSFA